MSKKDTQKIFLVFNTSHLGDTLLCNSLCQNIKQLFPDSKIVFIANKPFYEAAKYQKDVDEVIVFDKFGKHKGLFARLKFILNFPYKRADYAIVTYRNNTNSLIARLIMAKHLIECTTKHIPIPMQEHFINLLSHITNNKINKVPMKFEVTKDLPEQLADKFETGKKYISLCTLTNDTKKDIPFDTAKNIINILSDKNYNVVLLGQGQNAYEYSKNLKQEGCNFIDLINKTTIKEAGAVLKNCDALISADTGIMHLACAVATPVVDVFYKKESITQWAPDGELYKSAVISENQTAENICNTALKLIEK